MPENSHKTQSVDILLAVMSEQLKTVIESVKSIEKKLDSKVDIVDFIRLEKALEEHRRDSDLKHKDASDKIDNHTAKLSIGAGIMIALSWASNFLIK